ILYVMGYHAIALLFLILTVIVFIKHRANIERLMAGTEGKIGSKG
ncbi:MAG: glycerol-3-phosphate acyltransferase, partial [Phyllobacterium sp.]|nr:glycerol-3-phosphate acyltransferase [Phyllobacterium sp.]